MLYEKITVAKAPKNGDAWEASVGSSLDVNVAIANIHSFLLTYTQFPKCGKNGVGGWLLTDAVSFVLTDSHLNTVRKEMSTEFLSGSHHLITDNSDTTTTHTKGS